LARLFTAPALDPDWFSPLLTAKTPVTQVRKIVDGIVAEAGPYRFVVPFGDGFRVHFAHGTAYATIAIDASRKIDALYLAPAQTDPSAVRLASLFTTVQLPVEWFAPAFLAQTPLESLRANITQLQARLGIFEAVQTDVDGNYDVTFTKGTERAQIQLDAAGRIEELSMLPPKAASLDDPLAQLRALPGRVAYLVLDGGAEKAASNARVPLPAGSAVKLAVLNALIDRIDRGSLEWSDTVTLQAGDRSLPSGDLQNWPAGSQLTLATAATLMISKSDNTATDMLIRIAGRDAIAPYAAGNEPLLTTRELFALTSSRGALLREAWRRGTPLERRALLAKIDALGLPSAGELDRNAHDADFEWRYSAAQLCELIARPAMLPLMGINPGPADRRAWRRVAYEGGSDAGAINFTAQLERSDGRTYCVSATWNDLMQPVDETTFGSLYAAVLAALAEPAPQ
jgi:beta-lactamase class A